MDSFAAMAFDCTIVKDKTGNLCFGTDSKAADVIDCTIETNLYLENSLV